MNEEKEKALLVIIHDESLKEPETRVYVHNCFRDGFDKTNGVDIERILPPISRFGGGRDEKERRVIKKNHRVL